MTRGRYNEMVWWMVYSTLRDASIDSSLSKVFLQCQYINMDAHIHTLYYICPTKLQIHLLLLSEKITQTQACQSPSHCLSSKPLLPCEIGQAHYDVRQGVGTNVPKRFVEYAWLSPNNKFVSLNIRLYWHVPPSITIEFAFHTLSVNP